MELFCDPNDTVFKPIIRKIQEDIWVKGGYAGSDAATCNITQEAESSVDIVFILPRRFLTLTPT